MTTSKTSAHRAVGETLVPGNESAGMSQSRSEAVEQRGLLNFRALRLLVAIVISALDAALLALLIILVARVAQEVTR